MTAKQAERQIEGGREMQTECKTESEKNAIFRSLMCKSKCFLYNWVRTAQLFQTHRTSVQSFDSGRSESRHSGSNFTVTVVKRCHIASKRREKLARCCGKGRQAFLWTNENKAQAASL